MTEDGASEMIAIPWSRFGSILRTGVLALALTGFYLLLTAYCSLAITLLQIRQQIGPDFDTIFELSTIDATTDQSKRDVLSLTERAALAADPNVARALAGEAARISGEATILDEQKSLLQKRLKDLDKDEAKVAALTERVRAIAGFLNYNPVGWMARMPSDFVVLFLATMMGALGGALSTLRELVEEGKNPNPSDYVLRPALGFIVAIAVFTLFKAGQLVISNNINAQSSDSLNPFLIAFIGVVSGLVAKQAIASIESAGTSFFTARDEQKPLYGRELLASQIAALSPTDSAFLLSILKIDASELTAWQTEKRPIPKQAAEILSAFLHVNSRDLFAQEPKA